MSLSTVPLQVNLNSCDREPIHIPSAIQPHGVLLVFDWPEATILQASANASRLLASDTAAAGDGSVAGKSLADLLQPSALTKIGLLLQGDSVDDHSHFLQEMEVLGSPARWAGTVHRSNGVCVLELQPADSEPQTRAATSAAVRRSITELDTCRTLARFCQAAAEHFRSLTGFDRTMIYKFLPDGSGVVIGESRRSDLSPYLGLRYPASDIPVQARQLYVRNPFRLTADVDAAPVPVLPAVNPRTNQPLDMSLCALRATSPVHLEYLRNMGVAASLSFSILHDGELWGLVACHHMTARTIPQDERIAGEILARLVSLQVGLQEASEYKQYIARLADTRTALSDRLRRNGDFVAALMTEEPNLLTGISASGVALCTGTRILTLGHTPDQDQLKHLCSWVHSLPWQAIWSTNHLSSEYEPASQFVDTASGLLLLRLAENSPEAVLWFRPEVVEHVNWAGDPNKAVESNGTQGSVRLHPRRSFQLWREEVRAKSAPWQASELEFAADLRDSMSAALLQHRSAEINRLNKELVRSNRELEQFASVASHDLQEPLRTVATYTQLLLRRSELKNDANAHSMGEFIVDAVRRMSSLITNLLHFAQAGRVQTHPIPVHSTRAVRNAMEGLQSLIEENGGTIELGELPTVCAHEEQLARVFQNLISNAMKYRRPDVPPVVSVTAERLGTQWQFQVRDNGSGFDPRHEESIFESFSRLHSQEVSGTGLGLAICRKIVESFGGRIWATSELNAGSTFYLTLPGAESSSRQVKSGSR